MSLVYPKVDLVYFKGFRKQYQGKLMKKMLPIRQHWLASLKVQVKKKKEEKEGNKNKLLNVDGAKSQINVV